MGGDLRPMHRTPLALALSTALCGCPSGTNTAGVVKSAPPKLSQAMPEARCTAKHTEPLIVEWSSTDRAKLESLSHKGLVVVRYEKCELEILSQCRVAGAYKYSSITRKQDKVHVRDTDELWANIPLGAAKLEGKLEKAGELAVLMTIVGRWEADRPLVRADELDGECKAATHVVTAMATGAFELSAGSSAAVSGGASAMGAGTGGGSTSKSETLTRDGEEAKCMSSAASDKAPPDGCGALLRLEVVGIGDAKRAPPECPPKTEWDGSQCSAVQSSEKVEVASAPPPATPAPAAKKSGCKYGDASDCVLQCEANKDPPSCNDLARMYSFGEGVSEDDKKATTLYVTACDLGSGIGCNNAGLRMEDGKGTNKDLTRAAQLYQKGCDKAFPAACNNLGRMHLNGWGVQKDEKKAAEIFDKACNDGDASACSNLGWLYFIGRGVEEDRKRGVALLKKGCDGGNTWGCDRLKTLKYIGVK